MRAALPCRRIVERGFLRGVVFGDGKGHQLVKTHGLGPVVGQKARRHVGKFQATLHHQRRDAELCGNVLDGAAFGHQSSEEHTSELQSLMSTSYAVSCLTTTKNNRNIS